MQMRLSRLKFRVIAVCAVLGIPIIGTLSGFSNNISSVYAATITPRLQDSQYVGTISPTMSISLQFFLKPNNGRQLQQLAQSVSNPQSPNYRHFLTASTVMQKFSPSENTVKSVTGYLQHGGFTNIHVSQNHLVVSARSSAQVISRMFHATLGWYRDRATGKKFYSITSPVTVPHAIQAQVSQVYGLASNTFQAAPLQRPSIHKMQTPGSGSVSAYRGTVEATPVTASVPVGQPSVWNITVVNGAGNPVAGAVVNDAILISGPSNGTLVTEGPTGPNVIGGNGLSWTTNAKGQAQIYVRLSAPGTYQIAPIISINGSYYQGQPFTVSVTGSGSLWDKNGNFYLYSPSQINQAYNALPTIDQSQGGRGATIANIIEGVPTTGNPWGQSWSWTSDLLNYAQLVHQRVNFPLVIPVAGGASAFQYSHAWMAEGESDIERLTSAAPNANLLLYDAYTNSGLFDAVNKAIEQDQAQIVTMSWGGPSTPQGLFAMGTVEGITFFASSGDMGPYANSPSLVMSNYPANSVNVTGVGGTELAIGLQGQILSQGAWSPEDNDGGVPAASGGGFTSYVSEPSWQESVQNTTTRGTPDVSLMGAFGWYTSYIEGSAQGIGGTSESSPSWAGYLADIEVEDHVTGLGNVNPLLYHLAQSPNSPLNPITYGGNKWVTPWNQNPPGYNASGPWSPVTGLGTPNVALLAQDIAGAVVPSPTISQVMPGSAAPGALVRIMGANFGISRGTVTIGGLSSPLLFWTNNQIVVRVPNASPGTESLVVTTASKTQVTDSQFTVLSGPSPVIRTVFPTPANVGQTVRIYGEYFGNTIGTVDIGGSSALVSSWTPYFITVTVPQVKPGTEPLSVTTAAGQAVNDSGFQVAPPPTPVIRSLFPNPAQVGQTIRIFGINFGSTNGTVTIGGQPAKVAMWTPYFVEVVVPSVKSGIEPLVVTASNGQAGTDTNFTVSPPPSPTIRAVYPNPAKPGSIVYVSGMDFGTTPGTVMIGTTQLTVRSWSPYFVSVELPNSLTVGNYTLKMDTSSRQSATAKISIS